MCTYAFVVMGKEVDIQRFFEYLKERHPLKIFRKSPHDRGFMGNVITDDTIDFKEVAELCEKCDNTIQVGMCEACT